MSEFKFSCPACGQNILCDTSNQGMSMNCPSCNASITVPQPPPPLPPLPSLPASPAHHGSIPPNVSRTSGLAIASLICSLSSLVICIGCLPGIICGHCARAAMRRNPSLEGRGMAKAGLIIGYAVMVFTLGIGIYWGATFYGAVKQGLQDAGQETTTTNDSGMAKNEPDDGDSTNAQMPEAKPLVQYDKPAWTLDLSNASFPEHPVSGTVHGSDFVMNKSILQKGDIKISSDDGRLISIHGLTSIEGNDFDFQPSAEDGATTVRIRWKDENGEYKNKVFKNGFALKLKFGRPAKRKVHGQIYLCLPDDSKTCVAGNFTVTMPKKK